MNSGAGLTSLHVARRTRRAALCIHRRNERGPAATPRCRRAPDRTRTLLDLVHQSTRVPSRRRCRAPARAGVRTRRGKDRRGARIEQDQRHLPRPSERLRHERLPASGNTGEEEASRGSTPNPRACGSSARRGPGATPQVLHPADVVQATRVGSTNSSSPPASSTRPSCRGRARGHPAPAPDAEGDSEDEPLGLREREPPERVGELGALGCVQRDRDPPGREVVEGATDEAVELIAVGGSRSSRGRAPRARRDVARGSREDERLARLRGERDLLHGSQDGCV